MLRKRIKKKKPLLSFTKHKLLHSIIKSKSTYFYKQKWFTYIIPGAVGLALLIVMCSAINPLSSNNPGSVYAEEGISTTSISFLEPSGSLEITKSPDSSTVATAGSTAFRSYEVTFSGTNVDGMQLFLTADEGQSVNLTSSDGRTVLTGANSKRGSELENNTWGFSWQSDLEDTEEKNLNSYYYSLQEYGTTGSNAATGRLEATSKTGPITKKLTFAAKFGNSASAGHYTTSALLSLILQPQRVINEVLGFNTISYMQDMTPAVCATAVEGDTARLEDKRDHKKYWVSKMADGNCWMTQNLAIDLESITFTSSDSDVTDNWTPNVKSGTWSGALGSDPKDIVRYYNSGNYVYTRPGENGQENYCNGALDSNECKAVGWADVSGMSPSEDPKFGAEVVDGTYNAHYLAGNYYTWNAVTAGTGASLFDGLAADGQYTDASSSICPKGWRLPSSADSEKGSYGYLLSQYGYNNGGSIGTHNIQFSPFYFVAGGHANSYPIFGAGWNGKYWTAGIMRSSSSPTYLYAKCLTLHNKTLFSMSSNGPQDGFSVRCVAR